MSSNRGGYYIDPLSRRQEIHSWLDRSQLKIFFRDPENYGDTLEKALEYLGSRSLTGKRQGTMMLLIGLVPEISWFNMNGGYDI